MRTRKRRPRIITSGRAVALADLDLGASNAHTMLGICAVSRGIGTFLSLSVPGVANLTSAQRKRLARSLEALKAEYLVLDLGPGAGANALDFFLLIASGIVVTTPALTAIFNAYPFLKNVVFRLMYATVEKGSGAFGLLEEMRRDSGGLQKAYVPRIMERIGAEDPVSHAKLAAVLDRLRPRLVLNLLEDPADADKVEKLRRSVREYLCIELAHLGVIYRDELQAVALGSRIPIVRYKPGSVLSRAGYRIADKIMSAPPAEAANKTWPASPKDAASDDAGFQAAESEAATDFQAMRRDLEDLLHSGALTTGDLVEAVRTQQLELATHRRENAILRALLLRAVREGVQA